MPSLKDPDATFDNRLLAALPRDEYERLSPHLELVRLAPGQILYNVGDAVRHAYFPKGGMLSLLSITETGRTIEVGMIGNEGMAGIPIILSSGPAPYLVMVQLPCNALRIREGALMAEFKRGGRLQELLLRYTHALLTQVAQSAACNRFHTVEQRLCRWLLVSRDRVRADTLHLTQEFLSHMLGVPRTSVTAVAGALQERGLISYRRGKITILDRSGLKDTSCECYRRVREGVRQLLAA
jgi:CRP-like cAMP-binding protein